MSDRPGLRTGATSEEKREAATNHLASVPERAICAWTDGSAMGGVTSGVAVRTPCSLFLVIDPGTSDIFLKTSFWYKYVMVVFKAGLRGWNEVVVDDCCVDSIFVSISDY